MKDYKNIVFATVNGKEIAGSDIERIKKRILISQEEDSRFAITPNEDNKIYINTEALQKLIDQHSLLALASFEGVTPCDEEINNNIMDLRESFPEEAEWESNLHDLGLDNKNLRNDLTADITIDMLIRSRLDLLEQPNDEDISEFYHKNLEFMKHPSVFSFIELEIPAQENPSEAARIIGLSDVSSILKEAAEHNKHCVHHEEIPKNKLPEELQSVLEDLEESKIGSLSMEDGSNILIKLLKKHPELTISEEDAFPGLKEYLNIQQIQKITDDLLEHALEKCDIQYFNTEQLKYID